MRKPQIELFLPACGPNLGADLEVERVGRGNGKGPRIDPSLPTIMAKTAIDAEPVPFKDPPGAGVRLFQHPDPCPRRCSVSSRQSGYFNLYFQTVPQVVLPVNICPACHAMYWGS